LAVFIAFYLRFRKCGLARDTIGFVKCDARLCENYDAAATIASFGYDDVFCKPAEKLPKAEDSLGFSQREYAA
jgi:hypothetical protein